MRLIALLAGAALAGSLAVCSAPVQMQRCGTVFRPAAARGEAPAGGKYLTARGVVRVLLVFASFPDDSTPHPYWPAHQPPTGMTGFIDPDTTTGSTGSYNLTHYFDLMSLGALHVVGDVLWVESARSQEEYRNGSYGRANTDILKERVDGLVDFSRYDSWSCPAPFEQTQSPDSVVDMIVMVWRTQMFEYLGEASLGYKPGFVLDGKRIEMGYPDRIDYPRGSGVTCEYPYSDSPQSAMRTMAHELGHWLLGAQHPYNTTSLQGKFEYWGMLCTSHRASSCANTYERERLGWITVPELLPGSTVTLKDFLFTGDARKYHPPGGEYEEYFYLENHQRFSPFDDVSADPEDRGLWILHQNGPYFDLDNLRICASDGNWTWDVSGTTSACYGQALPVFSRGVPAVQSGNAHRDMLTTPTSAVEWMFVRQDTTDRPQCGRFYAGEGFRGSFGSDTTSLFSPYSNPSSATWARVPSDLTLEIHTGEGGLLAITSFATPLAAPPARRYLGHDPRVPRETGRVALAWGAEWTDGQKLESDVVSSELQVRPGPEGEWSTVYEGPLTHWIDQSRPYDSAGTLQLGFRSRVRDSSARYSPWSNTVTVRVKQPAAVVDAAGRPQEFGLDPAYPNPFNGISNFEIRIPKRGRVRVAAYDLLGREVATMVDEEKMPGRYTVRFDAGSLASGIYVVRLEAGGELRVRRVVLIR